MGESNPGFEEASGARVKRVRVVISGRVQGVCFRAYTMDEASSRGLSGWVRNLPSRQVEAVFQGSPELVDDMVDWCWQGSPYAAVDAVEAIEEEPCPDVEQGEFRVRY